MQLKWQIIYTLNVNPCVISEQRFVLPMSRSATGKATVSSGLPHSWAKPEEKKVSTLGFRSYLSLTSKQKMAQAPCFSPARLGKADISQTLHSEPFGDNFTFKKADIMTLPPTQSVMIIKVIFWENNMLCSSEIPQKQRYAAPPQSKSMHTDEKHPDPSDLSLSMHLGDLSNYFSSLLIPQPLLTLTLPRSISTDSRSLVLQPH